MPESTTPALFVFLLCAAALVAAAHADVHGQAVNDFAPDVVDQLDYETVSPSVSSEQFFEDNGHEYADLRDGAPLEPTAEYTDAVPEPFEVHTMHLGKGITVTTRVRGEVEVHDKYVQIDRQHHQHLKMVSRPTNRLRDYDPLAILERKAPRVFDQAMRQAQRDGSDSVRFAADVVSAAEDDDDLYDDDLEDQTIPGTQAWMHDIGKVLPEGDIPGEFEVPKWLVNKYSIEVDTLFSVPNGIFRVTAVNPIAGQTEYVQLRCHNAGLTDVIKNGEVSTTVEGSPSKVQDAFTNEITDLSAKASSVRDRDTLQAIHDDFVAARTKELQEQSVEDSLRKLHTVLWKMASNSVPERAITSRTIPAMVEATKQLYQDVEEPARELFAARAEAVLKDSVRHAVYNAPPSASSASASASDDADPASSSSDDVDSEQEEEEQVQDVNTNKFRFVRKIRKWGRKIRKWGKKIRKGLRKFGRKLVKGIAKFAKKMFKAIKKFAGPILKAMKQAVGAFLRGDLKGVLNAVVAVIKHIKNTIKSLGSMKVDLQKSVTLGKAFTNKMLFNYKNEAKGVHAQVLLRKAHVKFVPKFTFQFSLKMFRLQYFRVELAGNVSVLIDLFAKLNYRMRMNKSAKVAVFNGARISFMAGPVPIWIKIRMEIFAGFNLEVTVEAEDTVGGTVSSGIAVGLRYKRGDGFKGMFKRHFKKSLTLPKKVPVGTVTLEAFAKPVVAFLLYGIAGPTFSVEPYVQAVLRASRVSSWELLVGCRGDVGVQVTILGNKLLNKNYELFSKSAVVAKGTFTAGGKPAKQTQVLDANERTSLYGDDTADLEDEDEDEDSGIWRRRRRRRRRRRSSKRSKEVDAKRTELAEAMAARGEMKKTVEGTNVDDMKNAAKRLSALEEKTKANMEAVRGAGTIESDKKRKLLMTMHKTLVDTQVAMIKNFLITQKLKHESEAIVNKAAKPVVKEAKASLKQAKRDNGDSESDSDSDHEDVDDLDENMRAYHTLMAKERLFDHPAGPTLDQATLREQFELPHEVNDAYTVERVDPNEVSEEAFFADPHYAHSEELQDAQTPLMPTRELSDEEKARVLEPEEAREALRHQQEYTAHTRQRGDVVVNDKFVHIANEHHEHLRMVRRPHNAINDEDPLALMGMHGSTLMDRVHRMARASTLDRGLIADEELRDADGQTIPGTQQWLDDIKKILPEGDIAGEFEVPKWLVDKYAIQVGSIFSVPNGLFRVSHVNALPHEPNTVQLRCHNAGLLDIVKDGDVETSVQGAPSMVRDAETGEVTDMRTHASVQHDRDVLERMFAQWKKTAANNERMERVRKYASVVRETAQREATLAVAKHVQDMPADASVSQAVRDKTSAFVDDVAAHAHDAFVDYTQDHLDHLHARADTEMEDDDFASDDHVAHAHMREITEGRGSSKAEDEDDSDALALNDEDENGMYRAQDDADAREDDELEVQDSERNRGFFRRLGRAIKSAVKKGLAALKKAMKKFGAKIAAAVSKYATGVWAAMEKGFEAMADTISDQIMAFVKKVVAKIKKEIAKVAKMVTTLVNALMGKIDYTYQKGVDVGKAMKPRDLFKRKKDNYLILLRLEKAEAVIEFMFKMVFKIRSYKLKLFRATLAGRVSLTLRMLAVMEFEIDENKSKKLLDFKGTKVQFMLGPVPVWISIKPTLWAGSVLKAAGDFRLVLGGELSAGMTVGVEYSGRKFRGIFEKEFKNKVYAPKKVDAKASLDYEAYLSPRLAFLLYDVSGPEFSIEPYLKLVMKAAASVGATSTFYMDWDLALGIRGQIKVTIKLFGKSLLDKDYTLFDKTKTLLKGKLKLKKKIAVLRDSDSDAGGAPLALASARATSSESENEVEEPQEVFEDNAVDDELSDADALQRDEDLHFDEDVDDDDDDGDEEVQDTTEEDIRDADLLFTRRRATFTPAMTPMQLAIAEKQRAQEELRVEIEREATKPLREELEKLRTLKKENEVNLEQVSTLKSISASKREKAATKLRNSISDLQEGIEKNLQEIEATKEEVAKTVEAGSVEIPLSLFKERYTPEVVEPLKLTEEKLAKATKAYKKKKNTVNKATLKFWSLNKARLVALRNYFAYGFCENRAKSMELRERVEMAGLDRVALMSKRLATSHERKKRAQKELGARAFAQMKAWCVSRDKATLKKALALGVEANEAGNKRFNSEGKPQMLLDIEADAKKRIADEKAFRFEQQALARNGARLAKAVATSETGKKLMELAKAKVAGTKFEGAVEVMIEVFKVLPQLRSIKWKEPRELLRVVQYIGVESQLTELLLDMLPPKIRKWVHKAKKIVAFYKKFAGPIKKYGKMLLKLTTSKAKEVEEKKDDDVFDAAVDATEELHASLDEDGRSAIEYARAQLRSLGTQVNLNSMDSDDEALAKIDDVDPDALMDEEDEDDEDLEDDEDEDEYEEEDSNDAVETDSLNNHRGVDDDDNFESRLSQHDKDKLEQLGKRLHAIILKDIERRKHQAAVAARERAQGLEENKDVDVNEEQGLEEIDEDKDKGMEDVRGDDREDMRALDKLKAKLAKNDKAVKSGIDALHVFLNMLPKLNRDTWKSPKKMYALMKEAGMDRLVMKLITKLLPKKWRKTVDILIKALPYYLKFRAHLQKFAKWLKNSKVIKWLGKGLKKIGKGIKKIGKKIGSLFRRRRRRRGRSLRRFAKKVGKRIGRLFRRRRRRRRRF